MTTIAFKDGILATDSMYSAGDSTIGTGKKINIFEKYVIVGTGSVVGINTFLLFHQGLPHNVEIFKDENNSIDILVFEIATKKVINFSKYLIPFEYDAPFYTIGSGADYAMGAMANGATPQEAVRIASQFDKYTDSNIQELQIW